MLNENIILSLQEGKPFFCKVLIKNAHGLPMNIDKSFCRYKFYLDDKYTQTEEIAGTMNPEFHHEKKFSFKSATKQVINFTDQQPLLMFLNICTHKNH